jgi:hypothetical protein
MLDVVIYLSIHAAIAVALCGPAWWFARKRQAWFRLDYATILLPFAVWVVLAELGLGPASLANLVELVLLVAVIPVLVSLRVFVADKHFATPRISSIVVLVVCILATVALRAFMPLLPE